MAIPVTPPSPKLPEIMNALTPENMKEPSITKSKSLIFLFTYTNPFNVISLKGYHNH